MHSPYKSSLPSTKCGLLSYCFSQLVPTLYAQYLTALCGIVSSKKSASTSTNYTRCPCDTQRTLFKDHISWLSKAPNTTGSLKTVTSIKTGVSTSKTLTKPATNVSAPACGGRPWNPCYAIDYKCPHKQSRVTPIIAFTQGITPMALRARH